MNKVDKPGGQVHFRETQKYSSWWISLAIIASAFVPLVLLFILMDSKKVITIHQFGYIAPVVLVVPSVTIFFLLKTSLETVVTDTGIYLRWRPFHRRFQEYKWKNVSDIAFLKRVPAVPSYPPAANVPTTYKMVSSVGIEFLVEGGKAVFIGTEKPSKLQAEFSKFVNVDDQLKK